MIQNTISPVIGLITMGTSASVETYFHRHVPPQVEVATTRVAFEEVSYIGLLSMVAQLPAAARLLLSARPRVFAIPTMTGSCIKGNEIINVIQQHTGIPTVVPSLEFVNALHALNAPRVALVSIFSVELNILEKLFFATHGIDVRHVIRIEEQMGSEPSQLMPIDYGMYLDIIAGQMPDDAEAVVVDHPLFVLEEEQRSVYAERLGRPILFTNEILLDAALRRMEAGG